jgi:HD superfamily phosphohydrolase
MLHVHDAELGIDEKGIYSVEKFIISRRLMYWQVYMHKTVIAADQLLLNILRRAKELNLSTFNFQLSTFDLDRFAEVDDDDIMVAVKHWQHSDDEILSMLCRNLVNRRLPAIRFSNTPFEGVECDYFHGTGELHNRSYDFIDQEIKVLYKDGRCLPISEASDQLDRHFLEKQVTKYYHYFPKEQ